MIDCRTERFMDAQSKPVVETVKGLPLTGAPQEKDLIHNLVNQAWQRATLKIRRFVIHGDVFLYFLVVVANVSCLQKHCTSPPINITPYKKYIYNYFGDIDRGGIRSQAKKCCHTHANTSQTDGTSAVQLFTRRTHQKGSSPQRASTGSAALGFT